MRKHWSKGALLYSERYTEGLQPEYERTCPWPSGPRAPQGVEEHRVANVDGEDQDERIAETETIEAEVTLVSVLHIRAVRALKFCSISVSLAAVVTCDSIRDIQPVIVGICAICSLICANCETRASSFSSACDTRPGAYTIEVGARPVGRTKIRRREWYGRFRNGSVKCINNARERHEAKRQRTAKSKKV